jgi:hypothetical protein
MPAPTTPDALVALIHKSGLLEPQRLDECLGRLDAQAPPETARQLAAALVRHGLLTQFQAEQFLLGKYRGFTIGKYKVLERLGAGGNSNVYLCEHLMVQRRVAVKVLPTARSDNPAALARFYREARAAGVLDHPNLVRCHDVDQENGLHFLVMDYQAAVEFRGQATRVELYQNRIYKAVDGVLYRKADPPAPLDLALTANTFCAIEKAGVRLQDVLPVESSKVVLTRNLFARTATLACLDGFRPEPAEVPAQWIWFDETKTVAAAGGDYRFFRKKFQVEGSSVTRAVLHLACDTSFTVWVNGSQVGGGVFRGQDRSVVAFDVTRLLKPGDNLLAVQGVRRNADAGLLAQLTYTCAGAAPVTVGSGRDWRVSSNSDRDWILPNFRDTSWRPAVVVAAYGQAPWHNLPWEAVIEESFRGQAPRLFPEPSGNVCDLAARESFPVLRAVPLNFDLPADPAADARFLRYGRDSVLTQAGSPGVPPPERTAP